MGNGQGTTSSLEDYMRKKEENCNCGRENQLYTVAPEGREKKKNGWGITRGNTWRQERCKEKMYNHLHSVNEAKKTLPPSAGFREKADQEMHVDYNPHQLAGVQNSNLRKQGTKKEFV